MHDEAVRRTKEAGLDRKASFVLGNALDIPFRARSFDTVWGQDAWCYVTDKQRLLRECARVVRPGGAVAFTDWLETGQLNDELWTALHAFMAFPYMETLEGYARLAEEAGLRVVEQEDLEPGLRPARADLSRCPAEDPPPCHRGRLWPGDVRRGGEGAHPVAGRLGGRPGGPRQDHRPETLIHPRARGCCSTAARTGKTARASAGTGPI